MYNVYSKFNDVWEEVEIDINSLTKAESAYKELKAEDSTCQFTLISNNTIYNFLRSASVSDTPCKILKDNEPWFYGYIRKDFEFIETLRLHDTKIEIVSPSYYLRKKIGQDLHYTNITVTNLLTNLLIKAGVTVYTLPTITTIIPAFTISYDDDTTYHDVIYDLLFEYGYGFRFDVEGKLVTFNIFPTTIIPEYTFDKNSNTVGLIKQKNKEETFFGTVINWIGTKTLTNAIIFKDTSNGSSISECNLTVPKSSYYQFEEGENEYYAEYQTDEGELLSASNITLDIIKHTDISTIKFEPSYNKALLSFYNNNTVYDRSITKLNIVAGTAIIKSSDRQTKVVKVDNTEKIYEYDAKYIYDKDTASNLANRLAWYYQCTDYTYQLSSYTDIPLNSIVTIIATGSILAKVTEKIYSNDGLITYYLEAVSDYVAETADSTITVPQPNPPLVTPADVGTVVSNYIGSSGVVQDIVIGTGWTDTPTVPSLEYIAQINAIIIKWDRQANLSNLASYHIQVSNDNTNWYPLAFDRTDFRNGNAGEYTTWQDEQCIHTLPLADGNTFAYYYRVRRYTRDGIMSDWSIPIVGSTTLLDNGSFSTSEVYSNLVSATALQTAIATVSNSISINDRGFIGTTYDTAQAPSTNDRMLYLDKDELTITRYAPVEEPGISVEKTFSIYDSLARNVTYLHQFDSENSSGFWVLAKQSYDTGKDPLVYERYYMYRMERNNQDTYYPARKVLLAEMSRDTPTYYVTFLNGIIVNDTLWTVVKESTEEAGELRIYSLVTGELLETIDLITYGILFTQYLYIETFVYDGVGVWLAKNTSTQSQVVYINATTYSVLANNTFNDSIGYNAYSSFKVLEPGKVVCMFDRYYLMQYAEGSISITGLMSYSSYLFKYWYPVNTEKTKWISVYTSTYSTDKVYRYAYLTISGDTITISGYTQVVDARIIVASGQSKLYRLSDTKYVAYDTASDGTSYRRFWMTFTWNDSTNVFTLDEVVDLDTVLSFSTAWPIQIADTIMFSNWAQQSLGQEYESKYALYGYYGKWQEDLKIGGGSSQITADTITVKNYLASGFPLAFQGTLGNPNGANPAIAIIQSSENGGFQVVSGAVRIPKTGWYKIDAFQLLQPSGNIYWRLLVNNMVVHHSYGSNFMDYNTTYTGLLAEGDLITINVTGTITNSWGGVHSSVNIIGLSPIKGADGYQLTGQSIIVSSSEPAEGNNGDIWIQI